MIKRLFLVVIVLSLVSPAFAEKSITVTLTDEQYDAMGVMTSTPEVWLQNAVTNKSNTMVERLIRKHSKFEYNKLTPVEIKTELNKIDLQKEKNERNGIR